VNGNHPTSCFGLTFLGRPQVPTAFSPACQRAAQEAGLGEHYRGVPLREIPRHDCARKYGTPRTRCRRVGLGSAENVYEPPEYLTVDIARTINDGRIVVAAADHDAGASSPLHGSQEGICARRDIALTTMLREDPALGALKLLLGDDAAVP
jgi:hypothetical protein